MLPHDVPDLIPWVRAALAEWHRLAPDRFPGVPDWSHGDEWSTPTERALRARLRDIADERDARMQELNEREASTRRLLDEARSAADQDERALLTETGRPLVLAVLNALSTLGFDVIDADDDAPEDDHLEDLRITDSEAPGWIALVEVKGYTKGAKTEALTQFIRFEKRYQTQNGRTADAEWYIVNQFRSRDPSTRQAALHGKDDDIAAFASSGGLVIDTVELFRVLDEVRTGSRQAGDVRRAMREATGRWKT
jgi:hypothetical protein